MTNVYTGAEVLRAGSKQIGGPVGIVVERFTPPRPEWPGTGCTEQQMDDWRTQVNVVEGWPAQITVFWQDTRQVEHMLDTEVQFAFPHATYRADLWGFPLLAIDTNGYCDFNVRHPDGELVVHYSWLDEPNRDDEQTHDFRRRLHRLIDMYVDEVDQHVVGKATEDDKSAAAQTETATPAV